MHLDAGMDTGDMIYSESTPIGDYETSGALYDRLAVMGAELLIRTLKDIEAGTAPRIPQDNSRATYVKMLDKSLCPTDFTSSARSVIKHIYGLQPWPVATAEIGGETLKLFAAEFTGRTADAASGTVVGTDGGIEIVCGGGETVRITEVQAPGKKRMKASDYLRGHKLI